MEIKKFGNSMKNPENYPIKSFAQVKKITTHIFKKSVTLIVIIFNTSSLGPINMVF